MDSDVNGVCSFLDAQRLSKESALATDEQTVWCLLQQILSS